MLPLILCMCLVGPLIKEPHSVFATGLSLFPPFTPMLMLMRLSTPEGVPLWQPWLGLLGVLMCTVAAVWAGGRIFRVGILIQGKAPSLIQILKWTIRG
jgi:ABC-2 type transport system permease protein